MEETKKSDDRRGKRSEKKDAEEDAYAPDILTEGPQKFRFRDWASI